MKKLLLLLCLVPFYPVMATDHVTIKYQIENTKVPETPIVNCEFKYDGVYFWTEFADGWDDYANYGKKSPYFTQQSKILDNTNVITTYHLVDYANGTVANAHSQIDYEGLIVAFKAETSGLWKNKITGGVDNAIYKTHLFFAETCQDGDLLYRIHSVTVR